MVLNTFTVSWNNFNFSLAVLIFFAYLLIDALYAYYTILVVNKEAVKSATIGAIMHFLLAFGVINYVQNFLYIIPLALGSWFGTYIVVKKMKRILEKGN